MSPTTLLLYPDRAGKGAAIRVQGRAMPGACYRGKSGMHSAETQGKDRGAQAFSVSCRSKGALPCLAGSGQILEGLFEGKATKAGHQGHRGKAKLPAASTGGKGPSVVTWTGKEPAPGRASQCLEVVPNLPVEITHWRDHISHQPGSAPTPTSPAAPPHHFSKTQGNHKQAMSIRQAPWGIRCKRPSHCRAVPLITSTLLPLAAAGPHGGDESRRKAVPALLAQQCSDAGSSSAPGHSRSEELWGGRDGVRTGVSSRQRASASSLCNLVPPRAQLLVLLTEFPLSLPQVKSGEKKRPGSQSSHVKLCGVRLKYPHSHTCCDPEVSTAPQEWCPRLDRSWRNPLVQLCNFLSLVLPAQAF